MRTVAGRAPYGGPVTANHRLLTFLLPRSLPAGFVRPSVRLSNPLRRLCLTVRTRAPPPCRAVVRRAC